MRPLSASQALAPAFRRTWELLYRPFDWGSHLKLTLAAVLTSGLVVNFQYTYTGESAIEIPAIPAAYRQASGFEVFVIIAVLLAFNLAILLFYYRARLRFAIFHSIANGSRGLSSGFKQYERQAGRFFRAKVVVWLSIAGLVAAIVLVAVLIVFSVFTLRTPDGKYDAGVFLVLFFPGLGFAAAVAIVSILAQIVLNDFILPHMALEDASVGEAWRLVRKRMRADREAFFSYFLLRILILLLAGSILAALAFLLLWPAFWILGASATGYATVLDEATGFLCAVRVALTLLFSVLAATVGVGASALIGGPLIVFLRSHALYFYGSRFASLAKLLFSEDANASEVQRARFHPPHRSFGNLSPPRSVQLDRAGTVPARACTLYVGEVDAFYPCYPCRRGDCNAGCGATKDRLEA